ncbi:MAG: DUF6498-containing protein [Pseudomonadota bacterium]
MTEGFRINLPLLALVLANLVPVFGVLFLHWDVGAIVVLYWTENLVVGFYTLLKMLLTGGIAALGIMLFFCLHYGGFCAIHGVFVLELTQFAGEISGELPIASWPGPFVVIQKMFYFGQQILDAAPAEFTWACLALLLSHGASFMLLFIRQQEYRYTTVKALMKAPYKRIAVLHIAVIIGGFLVVELGEPLGLLLALVALKIGMDIMLHNRSHREYSRTGSNAAASGDTGP